MMESTKKNSKPILGLREFETREKEEKLAISSVWNIQET
jgi:hypothetical protein